MKKKTAVWEIFTVYPLHTLCITVSSDTEWQSADILGRCMVFAGRKMMDQWERDQKVWIFDVSSISI